MTEARKADATQAGSIQAFASLLAERGIGSACLLLAGAALLGVWGSIRYAREFALADTGATGIVLGVLALAAVAGCALFSRRLARRDAPLHTGMFLAILLSASFVVHLVLALLVQPQWGTDYLRYWQYAAELVETGRYGGFNTPYYARSLFFPYAVVSTLGPDATFAMKLVNLACLATIQLCLYDVTRRVSSHQAAQAASVLFAFAPIPAYSALIPSHDLWGLFFVALVAWSFALALDNGRSGRIGRLVLFAILAGLFAFLADVQRGLGVFLCAGFAVMVALGVVTRMRDPGKSVGMPLLAVGLMLVVFGACVMADRSLGLKSDSRPILANMKFAANGSGMGNGRSDFFGRFRVRFDEAQESEASAKDFAKSLALSPWSLQPADSLVRTARHLSRLYSLTYPRDWDWLLRKPKDLPSPMRQGLVFYADAFAVAFGLLLVLASVAAASRRRQGILVSGLVASIVGLSLLLALLFETKPFNIFPLWFLGSMLIAIEMGARRRRPDLEQARAPFLRLGMSTALLAASVVVVLVSIRAGFGVEDGRILSDWQVSTETAGPSSTSDLARSMVNARPRAFDVDAFAGSSVAKQYLRSAHEDGDRIHRFAGDLVTTIRLPSPSVAGGSTTLSTQACSDGGRNTLEFYLYSGSITGSDTGVALLEVSIAGKAIGSIDLPAGNRFKRYAVTNALRARCGEVGFSLRANRPLSEASHPTVEIWMPRLVH